MFSRILTLPVLLFLCSAADHTLPFDFSRSFDAREAVWVDSVFQHLTTDERLGQLFTIRAHSDKDSVYERQVEDLVKRYKPGGICFFNPTHVGTPEKQAELTNRYQAHSDRLPMMVSMDLENGLGMRFRDYTISYPRSLMLGAVQENRLIYEMGLEIARQCRRLGVHVNYAPVADINNNAENPVINERSYGENRYNVAAKAFQYMKGLQDGGVLACAKHFPGHGDTNTDSHYELPFIKHDREHLDSLELFPFRLLAQYGIGSFMIAHLQVPALDNRPNRPTTLSKPTVTKLLREEMDFQGLIFTDAMEMRGVAKYFPNGVSDLEAFKAGADMSLLPGDIGRAIEELKNALAVDSIAQEQIDLSIKRVLRAKYRLGITKPQRVKVENLRAELNTSSAFALKHLLMENALTLVRNRTEMAGFADLSKYRIATLALGDSSRTVFQNTCGLYAPIRHFNAGKNLDSAAQIQLIDSLRPYNAVLVSFHKTRSWAKDNFGLTESQINFVYRLKDITNVAVVMFGNPYSLRYFDDIPVLLQAYTEDPMSQQLAAQAMFGATDIRGKLPVTASPSAVYGQGIQHKALPGRLAYTYPEEVGMSTDTLRLMDDLVAEIISSGAAPGCQILVAKNGKVVWHKAYGAHNYDQSRPVALDDLYDLASVTKVAATTVSLMKLYDQGLITLDRPLSDYIPELSTTNKKNLTLREILTHHAGLRAWIPFYEQTVTADKQPKPAIYRSTPEKGFEIPIARNLYMRNDWVDTLWQQVFTSELRENKNYKYSDLGLYLGARTVRNRSGLSVDAFAAKYFYRPLGIGLTYNPWQKGLSGRCTPTEEDNYFRQQRLQGYVHDMGAAMLGGVSGHAGLFGSANDLAVLFQMLLNGGEYAGIRYLQPETVRQFTTRYEKSKRRGIGFDMKELDAKESQNMSPLAGPNTFGHLGFTGTCVWADPDRQLIFIFLSNRTYPTMNNNKLSQGDYRPRLQSIAYRAILK